MRPTSSWLAAAALSLTFLTTGCSLADNICGSDAYPVKAVGNTTGGDCVPKGEEPPAGYVRYPEGKVPKKVGDEWDVYWSTKVVDENGTIVSG